MTAVFECGDQTDRCCLLRVAPFVREYEYINCHSMTTGSEGKEAQYV